YMRIAPEPTSAVVTSERISSRYLRNRRPRWAGSRRGAASEGGGEAPSAEPLGGGASSVMSPSTMPGRRCVVVIAGRARPTFHPGGLGMRHPTEDGPRKQYPAG